MVKGSPLGRARAAAVVRRAEIRGQGLALFGQGGKHRFTALDVRLAIAGRYRVHPQGIERVAFRGDQIPAAITLFAAKKAAGVETRTLQQATEAVPLTVLCQPGLELFLLLAGGGFELSIAADLFRPLTTTELTVGIDDGGIGRLLHGRYILHTKSTEQNTLRRIGLIQRQLDRHDLTGLQLASHRAGQQHATPLVIPGHGRPCAHALSQGRCRL